MFILYLILKIIVIPIIIIITLFQWIGIFLVSCSAWIFNLIASLLFLLSIVAVLGGAGFMKEVLPVMIIAFVIFVIPYVGEWFIERIMDLNYTLRDFIKS